MTPELHVKDADALIAELKRDEGFSAFPYKDPVGVETIGHGRNLKAHGISRAEAEYLLRNDIADAVSTATNIFCNFYDMPAEAQHVICNMIVNLGERGFKSFRHMIAAIKRGDWQSAELELLGSKAAKQLPHRYQRLGKALRSLAEKKV